MDNEEGKPQYHFAEKFCAFQDALEEFAISAKCTHSYTSEEGRGNYHQKKIKVLSLYNDILTDLQQKEKLKESADEYKEMAGTSFQMSVEKSEVIKNLQEREDAMLKVLDVFFKERGINVRSGAGVFWYENEKEPYETAAEVVEKALKRIPK